MTASYAMPLARLASFSALDTSGKEKKGQQILEISACPESNDVIGLQDLYLQLDRSSVEMIVDEISSGLDPSGSNYTVSPSYNPERIVRN